MWPLKEKEKEWEMLYMQCVCISFEILGFVDGVCQQYSRYAVLFIYIRVIVSVLNSWYRSDKSYVKIFHPLSI